MVRRFADWPEVEERTYRMPGSCGEAIQGMWGRKEVLVTLPLNLYNSLMISRVRGEGWARLPAKMRRGMEELLWYLQVERTVLEELFFAYQAEIPVGVGMSSSTADLALGCGGLAHFLGRPLAPDELARLLVQIEPTDSIIFPEVTVFAQADAQIIHSLATYPRMQVLVLGTGEMVDTVAFRQGRRQIPDVTEALGLLCRGLVEKDCFLLGAGVTISAQHWQKLLPKPQLDELIRIAHSAGCYGIQVAHSGSVVGIMYDAQLVSRELLCSRLRASGVWEMYPYVWDLHTVAGGLEVQEQGQFRKVW